GLHGHLRETVFPAGDSDELRNPADAADERRIPFFEVHPRSPRKAARACADRFDAILEPPDQLRRPLLAADHAAQRADHAEDLGDAALIEEMYIQSGACQLCGDVRLQVREPEDEVGL